MQVVPGHEFGIGPHPHSSSLIACQLLEKGNHVMAVRFGVDFIAILDQERYIFIGAKASVQPKIGLHRVRIAALSCSNRFRR